MIWGLHRLEHTVHGNQLIRLLHMGEQLIAGGHLVRRVYGVLGKNKHNKMREDFTQPWVWDVTRTLTDTVERNMSSFM